MKIGNFRVGVVAVLLALAVFMQLGFAASLPMPMPNLASGMNLNLQLSSYHYSYNGGFIPLRSTAATLKSKTAAQTIVTPTSTPYQAYSVIGTPSTNLSITLQEQAALSSSEVNVAPSVAFSPAVSTYISHSSDIFDAFITIPSIKSTTIHRVVFPVYTNQMVTDLTTTLKPYIANGDIFDLVSGNNGGTLNVSRVLSWANTLHTAYPNSLILAHTAGLANYANLSKGVSGSAVRGVLYDYEPNMSNEPEFSWNFTTTLSNFNKAAGFAKTYHLTSIAYPTGRAMEETDLQKYGWDYAKIGQATNRLIIQSQTDCHSSVTKYTSAFNSVMTDYSAVGLPVLPAFQVTVGGGGVNAVDPTQAYSCTGVLTSGGLKTIYVWWSDSNMTQLESYLTLIGR